MEEHLHEEMLLIQLGSVVALGMAAQWIAWRLRAPSIFFLLVAGLVAGPVLGFIKPDELFGDILMPMVSIAVSLILFEGGLSLRISEIKSMGRTAWLLVTVGAVITWIIAGFGAAYLLGMPAAQSALLGAILVVTGPTVIGPMLRHIRPSGPAANIVKWEGILIDPVGAALAVLVFEAIVTGGVEAAPSILVLGALKTILIGVGFSVPAAGILILFMRRYWIPEHLHTAATLGLVVGAFTASNAIQPESGLLTVTIMGVILANQRVVELRHIIEFKENLRVVLLSTLFILLTARLDPAHMQLHIGSALFLALLFFVARPLSVFVCSIGSHLTWRERTFIAWMAPRGIVAASIASVFALRLDQAGFEDAELMISATFMVVFATVTVYGLTSGPLARRLKVAGGSPQGTLIIGAHPLARQIAAELKAQNFRALCVDSNWNNVSAARLQGLDAYFGDALSEHALDEIDFTGLGRLLALTPNNQVNALATLHFADVLSRQEVYQLPAPDGGARQDKGGTPRHLRGRSLFSKEATYPYLVQQMNAGGAIRTTKLTPAFTFAAFREQHPDALPLFVIADNKRLIVMTAEDTYKPQPGQRVISLITAAERVEEEEIEVQKKVEKADQRERQEANATDAADQQKG
jgi:NhaP-type Na+/H+ or K+/H+ antiporter